MPQYVLSVVKMSPHKSKPGWGGLQCEWFQRACQSGRSSISGSAAPECWTTLGLGCWIWEVSFYTCNLTRTAVYCNKLQLSKSL